MTGGGTTTGTHPEFNLEQDLLDFPLLLLPDLPDLPAQPPLNRDSSCTDSSLRKFSISVNKSKLCVEFFI